MATSIDFMLIKDTWANGKTNLVDKKMQINSDDNYGLVFKNGDNIYKVSSSRYWDVSGGAYVYQDETYGSLTATGNLTIAAAMYHASDSDTYFTFADDQATVLCGGVTMIDFTETTQDIISVNPGNVDVDFRVGATGAANAIFVNGATGAVSMEKTLQAQQLTGYNTADNAEAVGLRLWNYDPPLTGEVGQSVSIQAWLMTTTDGGSSYANENAGSIVFGKIGDYFNASGQADNDSYIGFLVCHNGTDTERMRLINSGLLQIGAAPANALSTSPLLTVNGIINSWSTGGGELHFYRDDDSIVDGNDLGMIKFTGADGGEQVGVQILAEAAGTWATGDTPGKIGIYTTPSGSATPVVRLTIDAVGDSTFAGNIYLADDKAVGISGGARFVFDATATPDSITITSADMIIGDGNYFGLGAAKGRLVFDDTTIDTIKCTDAEFHVEATTQDIAAYITSANGGSGEGGPELNLKSTYNYVTGYMGMINFVGLYTDGATYYDWAAIYGGASDNGGKKGILSLRVHNGSSGTQSAATFNTDYITFSEKSTGSLTENMRLANGHVGIRDNAPTTLTVLSMYGEAAFVRVNNGSAAYAIGLAYKYTNNSGSTISANRIVQFSTANDDSLILATQAAERPIGITAESIENGATGWVVVSGEAWVKFVSGNTPTRGYVAYTSTTDGEATNAATVPAEHNSEIGHTMRTGASGGIGKVQLHWN